MRGRQTLAILLWRILSRNKYRPSWFWNKSLVLHRVNERVSLFIFQQGYWTCEIIHFSTGWLNCELIHFSKWGTNGVSFFCLAKLHWRKEFSDVSVYVLTLKFCHYLLFETAADPYWWVDFSLRYNNISWQCLMTRGWDFCCLTLNILQ